MVNHVCMYGTYGNNSNQPDKTENALWKPYAPERDKGKNLLHMVVYSIYAILYESQVFIRALGSNKFKSNIVWNSLENRNQSNWQ